MKKRTPLAVAVALVALAAMAASGCTRAKPAEPAPPAPAAQTAPPAPAGQNDRPQMQPVVLKDPKPAPPFTLTDQNGKPYSFNAKDSDATLIFFGFTHCADVCPTTLMEYQQVIKGLGADAGRMRFLFVSVDPERDTPEAMKTYLSKYDPRIIGLTGSVADIQKVAEGYGILFEKEQVPNSTDYSVTHNASSFLIDNAGQIRVKFPYGTPTGPMIEQSQTLLKGAPAKSQAITVKDAWARPGNKGENGAIFLTVSNSAGQPDALTGGATDAAKAAWLDQVAMDGDMMGMKHLDRLDIPANGQIVFTPGNYHIMLSGLSRDLKAGDQFQIVLHFEKAGQVPVTVAVRQS